MQKIGRTDIVRMIQAAAAAIRRNESQLSALDAATGDGDHGTAMVRAVDAAEKVIEASPGAPLPELLTAIGWEVMCAAGGATGPLFGSLFTGMGESASGRGDLDAAAVAAMFEAGLASVREQTQAQVGDKTLLDALVPGVEALRAAADRQSDIAVALAEAAAAAEAGAESTTRLQARFGRARNLAERSIGPADPGATSVAVILRAFAEAPSHGGA